MLLSQKQKPIQRIAPAVQFDKFLKIRSQKQSIIHSQHQPIQQKVNGFEQLLKLTKTGSTIASGHHQHYKRHLNSQLHHQHARSGNQNKSESSKTLNVMGYMSPMGDHEFQQQNHRFLDDFVESDEAQVKRLNKMVLGVTEWEEARNKMSLHVQRGASGPKTSQQPKRQHKDLQRKQKTSKQSLRQRKHQVHTASPSNNKKFRKFYTPLTKPQASQHLTHINSQFIKTSSKLNYPSALLNCNFLSESTNQFSDLKQKIKILEEKARNQYGLKFQNQTQHKEKRRLWEDENSEEKENEELSFSDLELAPILAKEFPNRYKSYNQTVAEQENPVNDTSIPKSLIDIVQLKSQSLHNNFNITNNNFINPQVAYKKGKMKKGYLYRPKTFKPDYTYLKI